MAWIADIILIAATLGVGLYCWVLARRLQRFTDLESGVGGAVAVLSAQVDDLTKAVSRAQAQAGGSVQHIRSQTQRAEAMAQRLELLMASMHDVSSERDTRPVRNPYLSRTRAKESVES